jgi:hypothetical protein
MGGCNSTADTLHAPIPTPPRTVTDRTAGVRTERQALSPPPHIHVVEQLQLLAAEAAGLASPGKPASAGEMAARGGEVLLSPAEQLQMLAAEAADLASPTGHYSYSELASPDPLSCTTTVRTAEISIEAVVPSGDAADLLHARMFPILVSQFGAALPVGGLAGDAVSRAAGYGEASRQTVRVLWAQPRKVVPSLAAAGSSSGGGGASHGFDNAAALRGNVVLVERGGGATAVEIAQRVQACGALALVLVNNGRGGWPWVPSATPAELADGRAKSIAIPVLTLARLPPEIEEALELAAEAGGGSYDGGGGYEFTVRHLQAAPDYTYSHSQPAPPPPPPPQSPQQPQQTPRQQLTAVGGAAAARAARAAVAAALSPPTRDAVSRVVLEVRLHPARQQQQQHQQQGAEQGAGEWEAAAAAAAAEAELAEVEGALRSLAHPTDPAAIVWRECELQVVRRGGVHAAEEPLAVHLMCLSVDLLDSEVSLQQLLRAVESAHPRVDCACVLRVMERV